MNKWPNLFLIAGTNRNVGKTTFACQLIAKTAKHQEVWAVKITPHIHSLCSSCKTLFSSEHLIISEELSKDEEKDSSKMLAAGAQRVIYIQGSDERIPEIVKWMNENISNTIPVVCESAVLRRFVEPGIFAILSKTNGLVKNSDLLGLADIQINDFSYPIDSIEFSNNEWLK